MTEARPPTAASAPSARKVVVVSFVVDLLDVVTNLAVALVTGSAVVFAEMAQGVADSIGSALLVLGERRAARPGDAKHPLGYAREAFFWGLLSAVAMLIFGAGLSAWRGFAQLTDPQPVSSPWLAVGVLVFAIFTNSYAVSLSVRKLAAGAGPGGIGAALKSYRQPLVKGAFLRDVIGTSTSVIGLVALSLYAVFDLPAFDALGALVAAAAMAAGAVLLMAQARALIAGRSLPDDELKLLHEAILADPGVEAVNGLVAIYAGASEVLIDTDLDLDAALNTTEIEAVLDAIEARVRVVMPEIERVRVLLNSPVPELAQPR